MGVIARYPIALAPGMGLNAYFTYTVCLKMHIPWQTALGAVFLSGCIFLSAHCSRHPPDDSALDSSRALRGRCKRQSVSSSPSSASAMQGSCQRSGNNGRPGQHPQSYDRTRALRPDLNGRPRDPKRSAAPFLLACSSPPALPGRWAGSLDACGRGFRGTRRDVSQARHPRGAQQRPARNHFRFLLCRSLR